MLILNFIQNHIVCSFLTPVMLFFTDLGNGGLLWVLLAFVLLTGKGTRRYGLILAVALLLSLLLCDLVLKNLIARPRPFAVHDIALLIAPPGSYSFPSGHTASSFAAATVLWFWQRKWGLAAYVCAGLIAFSRLYFYVHYPGDIVGGIVLGLLLAVLASLLVNGLIAFIRGGSLKDELLLKRRKAGH